MYSIKIIGESESDWRGAVPEEIDSLVEKPNKDTATLLYQVVKTQIELLCQKGDTLGAMEALEKYRGEQFTYSAPLNVFKRDHQNGNCPFMGAHCFVGAFRDAAKMLYGIFYQKKGDKNPAAKHFRKFVRVAPFHIFLYRPDLKGEIIKKPDITEGQQPSPDVPGFAKYETIHHPFQFQFRVIINPDGFFKDFLTDKEKVIETLYQASLHGAGACRSAGYGMWKILSAEVEEFIGYKEIFNGATLKKRRA